MPMKIRFMIFEGWERRIVIVLVMCMFDEYMAFCSTFG